MQQPFSGMMLFYARFHGTSIPKGAKRRTLQRNTRNKCIITSVLAFLISGYLQLTVLYFDNFHPFRVFPFHSVFVSLSLLGWMAMTLDFSFLSVVVSLVKIISFFITILAVGLSCLKLVVHSSVLYVIKMNECFRWSVHHFLK